MGTVCLPKGDWTLTDLQNNVATQAAYKCIMEGSTDSNQCDATMKDFCTDDNFKDSVYCSCVNSPLKDIAQCLYAPCANCPNAYRLHTQKVTTMRRCPDTINCSQQALLEGQDDILSGVHMEQNCGTTQNVTTVNMRTVAIFLFILSIAILIYIRAATAATSRCAIGESSRATTGT